MTTTAAPASSTRRSASRPTADPPRTSAMKAAGSDLAALTGSIAPFGLALGLTATTLGTGSVATLLGAGITFAGSAQLTAMTMLASGAGAAAVITAAVVVNARLLLYGAALDPWFRQQSLWFRLVAAHFIIDGTYLAATARTDLGDPATFRRYWWSLGAGVLVVWSGAVGAGVLAGPFLPELPHLGLVAVALFLSMLLPRLTSRPAVVAAAAATVVAPLVAQVVPSLAILAGATAGVVAGTLTSRRTA